jgi:rare lipoprotein A
MLRVRVSTQLARASSSRFVRTNWRSATTLALRAGHHAPEAQAGSERADTHGMMTRAWIGAPFTPRPYVPSLPLAEARRSVALLLLSLFAIGVLVPGDAIAHAARERAARARRESGWCSYYGREFFHQRTASGERLDPNDLTAAHRTLPFGTRVRVTNLENGRRVVVRINDRGPFKKGRVLDVTPAAARKLGFANAGLAHVRLDVLDKLPAGYATLMDAPAPPAPAAAKRARTVTRG